MQQDKNIVKHHIHKPIPIRPVGVGIQTYCTKSIWPEEEKAVPSQFPYRIKTDHHHDMSPPSSPPPHAPKAVYTFKDDLSPIRRAIDDYIDKYMKENDIDSIHNLGRMLLDRVKSIL